MTEPAKDEAELLRRIEEQSGWDGQWLIAPVDAIAAIRKAGWAVVPVEPTKEMFDAVHASSAHGHGIVDLYRAMIEAALEVKP
jgi:hypothetical protein